AREIQVTHSAAIGTAPGGFELVDDLHGADFGCAADCANGQGDAQGVQRGHIRAECAGDVGGDVHYVAVALHRHDVADDDRPDLGNTPHIVAVKVDEHDVLRALLGIGQKFLL